MTSDAFLVVFRDWGALLWPDFAEHDGCVFRASLDDRGRAIYRNWLDRLDGDRRRVEAVMNHIHIADLLEHLVESPSREVILTCGRTLKDLWMTKLHHDFKDRRFIVDFSEDQGEDLVDYEITFYQTA